MLQAGTGHRLASHDHPTKPRPSLAGTLDVAAAADRPGHRGRRDRSLRSPAAEPVRRASETLATSPREDPRSGRLRRTLTSRAKAL